MAVGGRAGGGGQPHPEPGAAGADPRGHRVRGRRAAQQRAVGPVLRRVPQAVAGDHRGPDPVPGPAVHRRPGPDGAVHAAVAADARGQRAEARRRGQPRGDPAGVLRGAPAGHDPVLRRRRERAGQRPPAAALRAGRALRGRGGLRDRADLRPAAGHRRGPGPRGAPAPRPERHRPAQPAPAGDAGPRGRPRAVGRPRRRHGLPRLRPYDGRVGRLATAHRGARVRRAARRLHRHLRAARRHRVGVARDADAAGRPRRRGRRPARGRPAERTDPLPARPVGAARVAGLGVRRGGRDGRVRRRTPAPGRLLPGQRHRRAAGAAAGRGRHPGRPRCPRSWPRRCRWPRPRAAPRRPPPPDPTGWRWRRDRAAPGRRHVRRRGRAGALRRGPDHPRGRAGPRGRPHRLRQDHAAAHPERAGPALLRRHPARPGRRRRPGHPPPPAARPRRRGRVRRAGPARRLRHRHRRGRAGLRHGVAGPRPGRDAQAGRGDPRPARPRRGAQPPGRRPVRRPAAARRDRVRR